MKKWNEAEIVELNIAETAVNTNWEDHYNWMKEAFLNKDLDGDGWIGHKSWGNKVVPGGNVGGENYPS